MKTRLLIVIVLIISVATGLILIANSQEIMLATKVISYADCKLHEIRHNDQCISLDVPEHIGRLNYGTDSIISYCEDIPTPPNTGFGLERCIPIEFLDVDELIDRVKTNNTEPLTWPSSLMHSWCAQRFDQLKAEYLENFDGCDTTDCNQKEPALLSSAFHNDEEFIEKRCSTFIEDWAYKTEDNDYTWNSVYWDDFNQYHYERKTYPESEVMKRCADLFDQIMISAKDSNLQYELTDTDEFRELRCASNWWNWDDLTEHNLSNIGIVWKDIASNEEPESVCDPGPVLGDGWCYKNGVRVDLMQEK
jgi:hypothetical protein